MRKYPCCLAVLATLVGCAGRAAPAGPDAGPPLNVGRGLLPPPAGAGPITPLGGLPMAAVVANGGRTAVVLGMGYEQAVSAVDTASGRLTGRVTFSNATTRPATPATGPASPESGDEDTAKGADRADKTNGVYYGLAAVGDTVYAAQGGHDAIAALHVSADGGLTLARTFPTEPGDFPAGLAADAAGRLYVVDNAAGGGMPQFDVRPGLSVYDPVAVRTLGRFTFDTPNHLSNFPLAVAVRHDGGRAYVTCERDGTVAVLDTSDPAHISAVATVAVGSHPSAVLLSPDGRRLFVANGQSDTVSVIDAATNVVAGTVLLRPGTSRGPANATPVGLSLSGDRKTLYVALADLNAVGVVDVPTLSLTGLVPTGWYPSATVPTADGKLLVVTARGHSPRNPTHYDPFRRGSSHDEYVFNRLVGDAQRLPVPTGDDLARDTAAVLHADHLAGPPPAPANPLAGIDVAHGGITHVIYIVKENRTYDQVLGDDPRGNGDASLCLFGRDVTPNLHALADRFVLLDNCYACGDVSGDGWVWSTQGTANAYVVRNMPYQYSHRGRTFDYEGQNNGYITAGFPAADADGKPLVTDGPFRNGAPAVPDVAQSAPHLWDAARAAGRTLRNYGFFLSYAERVAQKPSANADAPADAGPIVIPEDYPTAPGLQPPGHDGAGVTDADFRRFDLDYADSDAPAAWFGRTRDADCLYKLRTFGRHAAPSRFAEWDQEFQQMLARDPTGNGVPNLMMIRLPHDHTQGLSRRHHTPASEVADNDYAVGQLVDAVSHSPIWPHTAIFVIEDDAQAGPDHVDCHRTTAYVISPFVRRASVDHSFANTDTLLRTMGLILGTTPLCAYDAAAAPLADWTGTADNAEPYTAVLPPKSLVAQVTPGGHAKAAASAGSTVDRLADASDRMDFTHADAAPADVLNLSIWASVRGPRSAMPPPRNTLASGPAGAKRDRDGDDDGD